MMPSDRKRFELLAKMHSKLTHEQLCSREETEELLNGHDSFINEKITDPVKVINNIEMEFRPAAGLNGGFHSNGAYC